MSGTLFENSHIMPAFPTAAGGAINGDWVCLRAYHRALLIIKEVRGASGVETVMRVDKASTAAAGGEVTGLALPNWWSIQDVVTAAPLLDAWTKMTAIAATLDTTAQGETTQSVTAMYAFEINADELGFDSTGTVRADWVQATIVSSNGAHSIEGYWILYEARYAQNATPTIIA